MGRVAEHLAIDLQDLEFLVHEVSISLSVLLPAIITGSLSW